MIELKHNRQHFMDWAEQTYPDLSAGNMWSLRWKHIPVDFQIGVYHRYFREHDIRIGVDNRYWNFLIEWKDGEGKNGWSERSTKPYDDHNEAMKEAIEIADEQLKKMLDANSKG